MVIGSSVAEVFLRMSVGDAFALALWAGADVGKVLESSATTSSLVVRTNYGLQRVKLRISLHPSEGGTTVKIGGASDDLWGAGARKGSDKYIAALNRHS